MALALADQPIIGALLRSDTESTIAGLKPFFRRALWLGTTNRYAQNVVARLKVDDPLDAKRRRNLAQYISASAVLHANDAWGYLGRSVASLVAGDAHRSLHLAYYAELRSAMSLLASGGIGIFDRQHYVIHAPNDVRRLASGSGTHQLVWGVLDFWSQQAASGALFADVVRPQGRTLEDWFSPHGGTAPLAAQAQQWFMQWGMDLSLAAKDRQARNESSYRPDGIPDCWDIPSHDVLEFTRDLWRVLQPGAPSSFDEIDRYILRLAIERHFTAVHGGAASAANPTFLTLIDNTLAAQAFAPPTEARWRAFLTRAAAPEDPQILGLSAMPPASKARDPLAVISRAVLLLRVATGSANQLLKRAGIAAADIQFWWERIGEARGLWAPGSIPSALSDLWADVQDALDDIENLVTANPSYSQSINGIATGLAERVGVLCRHERAGLWGICSP